MRFKIYRDSWRRGGIKHNQTDGKTLLLNDQQKMCCLGQILHEAGVPLRHLGNIGDPENLPSYKNIALSIGLLDGDACGTDLTQKCVDENDSETRRESTRERKIAEALATAGHQVEFVDGVAPWFLKKRRKG